MANKRLTLTDDIKARIQKVAGEGVDVSGFSVFECVACNTLPVKKRGLFDGAVIAPSLIREMQAYMEADGSTGVPMMIMHNRGEELPIGKAFAAKSITRDDGGFTTDLNVMFYLPASEQERADKIEAGVIDEVSPSILSKHILCSECGWDYNGPDATFMNLFEATCANDHKVGTDGIHVRLVGFDSWFELSLVDRGAGNKANILPNTKSRFSAEQIQRLAARGTPPEMLIFNATATQEKPMDLSVLTNQVADLSGKLALSNAHVTTLTASEVALKAKITELEGKLSAAEAAKGEGVKEVQAKLDAANTELALANTFLGETVTKVMVAAGTDKPEVPAEMSKKLDILKDAKFAAFIGGKSNGTGKTESTPFAAGAFRSKQ